uniref:Uncharacterized protein n=1 Tax=Aegilops tauschii subsp. strangulata TaxID=200361 RepID=A0A453E4K9_AEGTS
NPLLLLTHGTSFLLPLPLSQTHWRRRLEAQHCTRRPARGAALPPAHRLRLLPRLPVDLKKVYSHIELNYCYIRLIQTYCIFNGFHCWAKSSDGRPCGCRSHGCAVHFYAGPNCPSSVYLSEVAGSCKAWPTATTLGAAVLCILRLGKLC